MEHSVGMVSWNQEKIVMIAVLTVLVVDWLQVQFVLLLPLAASTVNMLLPRPLARMVLVTVAMVNAKIPSVLVTLVYPFVVLCPAIRVGNNVEVPVRLVPMLTPLPISM